MPVGIASLTIAMQRTSDKGVKHQAPALVLVIEGDQVAPVEHVEQAGPKRRAFTTSFCASKL